MAMLLVTVRVMIDSGGGGVMIENWMEKFCRDIDMQSRHDFHPFANGQSFYEWTT